MSISLFKGADYNGISNNQTLSSAKLDSSLQEVANKYPNSDISQLMQRSTVSGQVIATGDNEVTLLLDNNTTINAKVEGSSQLLEGMLMSFEVKGGSNNSLSLRPLFINMNNLPAAKSALDAASLPATPRNLEMTNALMNESMSISKDALLEMAKTVASFPNHNPADIVSLTKLGMPVNETNLNQFSNYQNFEHHIINDVVNLSEGIPQLISENMPENVQEVLNTTKEIIDMLEESVSEIENTDVTATENGESVKSDTIGQNVSTGNVIENKISDVINNDAQRTDKVSQDNEDILTKADVIKSETIDSSTLTKVNNLCDMLGLNRMAPNADNSSFLKTISTVIEMLNDIETESDGEDGGEKQKSLIKDNLMDILGSKDFADSLSDSLKSQWTLKPEYVAKEDAVSKLYERTLRQTQRLINILEQSNVKADSLLNSAASMNENVNFMNQLNQFVNYVQIPLKMNNQDANGELLVYTNKKNLKDKDGNLTALLHLDMDNLGPMDVYVSMTNYDKVSTHFYLQSDELIDFIESNLHILDERLNAKGYNMKSVVSKKESGEFTPITEEFVKDDMGSVSAKVSSLRFDVRA